MNPRDFEHLRFFENMQKKQKEINLASDLHRLNNQLNRNLLQAKGLLDISISDWEKEDQFANRYIVQSNLWRLSYRNNFESPEVAALQILYLKKIVKSDYENTLHGMAYETDRLKQQFFYLDNQHSIIYNQLERQFNNL